MLLVEDDPGDALIVRELLADAWPALEVHHVESVAAAEAALSAHVDCVVLDLGLPDAQGMTALARIQSAAPQTAVVVLTGDADQGRGIEALTNGAQDYIVKGEIRAKSFVRVIGYSIQRKLSELSARELAVLRVQSAENVRVQRGLIPRPLLEDDRVAVHSAYHPGNRRQVLGGDFFDVVQPGPGLLHAVLGDVCGRGPDEAALGVQLRIAWRTLTLVDSDQQTVLSVLDRLVAKERPAQHIFVTLASLSIDLNRGRAWVALAGHPSPILAGRRTARLAVERPGGPPLGLGATNWQIAEVSLEDPWTLLLYSDGIYEGHAGPPGQRLGLSEFVDLVSGQMTEQTRWDELPDQLIHRVEALNGGPLDDDVALLALSFDGQRS